MTKSKCCLVIMAVLFVVGSAEAAPHKANLKSRQTQKVASVTRVSKSPRTLTVRATAKSAVKPAAKLVSKPNIGNTLRSAVVLAESLDDKAGRIIDAMSVSRFNKWLHNIDEKNMKAQYAEELMVHMTRMTALFGAHRQGGPFAKFSELEFQNLLVKSDYLLSLAISRESLQFAHHKDVFAKRFSAALAAYNVERVGFDQKMIRFAFN